MKELIDQMAETEPESVEPIVLRAEILFAQGESSRGSGQTRKGARSAVSQEHRDQNCSGQPVESQERVDEALSFT